MPNHSDSPLHRRVLLAAFEGWSDAGSAATTAVQHLGDLLKSEVLHAIGADGYVDYQVHRPHISFNEAGDRVLEWPETRLSGTVERPGTPPSSGETVRRINGAPVQDLFLLAGAEPSNNWTSYADEILDLVETWGFDTVIVLGSMFSDAPHSRPIEISMRSESPVIRAATGATRSDYTGPAGITSVLDIALSTAGVNVLTLWAQVPHYVHTGPSPKATLALLDRLEELLDVVIPRGDLLRDATEWEAHINRIAAADDEMGRYIRALEVARDTTHAPEATGEAIAHEFEKFLNIGHEHEQRHPAVISDFPHPESNSDAADDLGVKTKDVHEEGLDVDADDSEKPDTTP